jgi:hypothetical protein
MKLKTISVVSLIFSGCIMNPTPNAGQFHMSDADTKASQFNAMQTKALDRASMREDQLLRKEGLRDEAEVRAWESNISRPNNSTVIVP